MKIVITFLVLGLVSILGGLWIAPHVLNGWFIHFELQFISIH